MCGGGGWVACLAVHSHTQQRGDKELDVSGCGVGRLDIQVETTWLGQHGQARLQDKHRVMLSIYFVYSCTLLQLSPARNTCII